jgi:uncharacterized protein YndB with AHSA1/START domain
MPEPFINKEIAIQALVSSVWKVLVKKQYIKQWIYEFSQGTVVTEDWHLKGTMAMTDDDGTVLLEGRHRINSFNLRAGRLITRQPNNLISLSRNEIRPTN